MAFCARLLRRFTCAHVHIDRGYPDPSVWVCSDCGKHGMDDGWLLEVGRTER